MGERDLDREPVDDVPAEPSAVDGSRRKALQRIAKYAAYTAPALVALLTADKAMATIGSVVQ